MMKNYGSQLQARATVKAFEDMGLDYEIIQYNKKGLLFKLKALPRIFNPVFINDKLLEREKRNALKKIPEIAVRNRCFDDYSTKYFGLKTVSVDYFSELQELATKYEAVVTCSDQLWSPSGLGTNFYNLMFVPDNVKKVSWASSFGVSVIPWYQINATRKYLKRIENISVRENQGASIVKNLTGREVPVLMDPVFVYTKEQWKDIVPAESIYDFPYILCYFLGNTKEYRLRVEEFAKRHNIKIVAIRYANSFIEYDRGFGDYAPFDVNPDKFLNLLRGAKYVCTDSFHGAAFSIIMEKQFAIFNRYADGSSSSKNSRIESLCQNLHLDTVRASAEDNLDNILLKKIDYNLVKEHLGVYIENSWDYLRNAFGVKNN